MMGYIYDKFYTINQFEELLENSEFQIYNLDKKIKRVKEMQLFLLQVLGLYLE